MSEQAMSEAEIRADERRRVCRAEGHGELVETTTFDEVGLMESFIRQRGCGITIKQLKRSMTIDELTAMLERRKISGIVRLRGTIEVER